MPDTSKRSSFLSEEIANEDIGPALRMIYELQLEARAAVDTSQKQWVDTAYSLEALQCELWYTHQIIFT